MDQEQAERIAMALERIAADVDRIERHLGVVAGDTDYRDVSLGDLIRAVRNISR